MPSVASQPQVIASFASLRARAAAAGTRRVAIVVAEDEIALTAAHEAYELGIAEPVLIGDPAKIHALAISIGFDLTGVALIEAIQPEQAARLATEMARRGEIDILLKGHLRTDQLQRAWPG